jgi:hypothetical protein
VVIEAAGRPNDDVNAATRRMRVMAKVAMLVTSLFAVGAIIHADKKVKEAARQSGICGLDARRRHCRSVRLVPVRAR